MENSAAASIKIALVNPRLEGPYPPLGLAYLAAYLNKYGSNTYQIKIIDGNCSKDVIEDILEFAPSLVGFTALSPQIQDTIFLSESLRSRKPDIFQVIGGLHVSAEPENTLKHGNFDLAVLGEGEETFREIVDTYVKFGSEKKNYRLIKGIAFVENEKFNINSQREEILDLDRIPTPDRTLLNMSHYLSYYLAIRGLSGNRITTIHTARGCPYNCVFCSCGIVFKKVRYFSVDYVILEIKSLINEYQVKSLFFTDDTFIVNKDRVKQLCHRLINEGINKKIRWEVQCRANLISWQDLPLLKLMKQAGCVQIDYGFETGSDAVLKFLKKKDVSIEFNQRAIEVTKESGLNVMGTFMVGVPGETEKDLEMTRNFILKNKDKIDNFQVFIATPYPGAELYEMCKSKDLVVGDYFEQLSRQKQNDFVPFYSDTVSYDIAFSLQKTLNKLAASKLSLGNKLGWLFNNFFKSPVETVKKIYVSLIQ